MKKTYRRFRHVAVAEGISFIVLLFIAMPLKYFAGMPIAVTIIGALHGILFMAFCAMAWEVKTGISRNMYWLTKALLASVLPFGTIVMDKQWKKEEAEIS
jgi:integral membrane protein